MEESDDRNPSIRGLTYFEDFIRLLEKEYAEASVISVAEEIEYVRSFAPARALLERREDGVFILKARQSDVGILPSLNSNSISMASFNQ